MFVDALNWYGSCQVIEPGPHPWMHALFIYKTFTWVTQKKLVVHHDV